MIDIINGECLEDLKTYPDNHFTSIITDPPYGLSFMGKKWDYDVPSIEIWKECLRVLKPGGTLLCFAGSRTQHRMAVNIEDSGFYIKDCLMWLYGSGFPKATDISKQIDKIAGAEREMINTVVKSTHKNGTAYNWAGCNDTGVCNETAPSTPEAKLFNGYKSHALKPAYEPIIMAMKPNESTYASNALKWGVSGINIDKGRIGTDGGGTHCNNRDKNGNCLGHKDENGKYHETFHAKDIGNNPQGRFPANIILDEEAAELLDKQTGILKSGSGDRGKNGGGGMFSGIAPMSRDFPPSKGGASRFFYCAKASKSERNKGCEELGGNKHCTVKPLALMKYLINLIMPPKDGLILDLFAGSGTTLLAAKELGFNAVGIEREPEYCEIAKKRLDL